MLGEIEHTMLHFEGKVKGIGWPIFGFVIPLELLAFEAITYISTNCREVQPSARQDCPRMCQTKFKKSGVIGYTLNEINYFLGNIKVINSKLQTRLNEEMEMLADLSNKDEEYSNDRVLDSWIQQFRSGLVVILNMRMNQMRMLRILELDVMLNMRRMLRILEFEVLFNLRRKLRIMVCHLDKRLGVLLNPT